MILQQYPMVGLKNTLGMKMADVSLDSVVSAMLGGDVVESNHGRAKPLFQGPVGASTSTLLSRRHYASHASATTKCCMPRLHSR